MAPLTVISVMVQKVLSAINTTGKPDAPPLAHKEPLLPTITFGDGPKIMFCIDLMAEKFAVTFFEVSMVKVHFPVPAQSPLHPMNTELLSAVAVSSTVEFWG